MLKLLMIILAFLPFAPHVYLQEEENSGITDIAWSVNGTYIALSIGETPLTENL